MEEGQRLNGIQNLSPIDPEPANQQPNHLKNFQNNLQPRQGSDNHVTYEKVDLTISNLVLPVSLLGVTILGVLFVIVIFIIWIKSYMQSWRMRRKSPGDKDLSFVKTMAHFGSNVPDNNFNIDIDGKDPDTCFGETPTDVNLVAPDANDSDIRYIDETAKYVWPIVTTKNYGGSSPKLPGEDKGREPQAGCSSASEAVRNNLAPPANAFFPSQEESHSDGAQSGGAGVGKSSGKPSCSKNIGETSMNIIESKCGRFKIAIPDQKWVIGHPQQPFDYKNYSINMPKPYPLAEVVKNEFGDQILASNQSRSKTFSLTRSPSLEKDDKSPFVYSAKSDKNDVFGFEKEALERIQDVTPYYESVDSSDEIAKVDSFVDIVYKSSSSTPVVEVHIQPIDVNSKGFDGNSKSFNRNVTPISPKELSNPSVATLKKSLSITNDNNIPRNQQTESRLSNLRRFCSVNTKLNICSVVDTVPTDRQYENSEVQNSPRILECSSAKEKYSGTRFNFSPKLLTENQNSLRFFDSQKSPKQKIETGSLSPKIYMENVDKKSPKLFENASKSISPNFIEPTSPKFFTDQGKNRGRQNSTSPRILHSGVRLSRSPKVISSSNKENYFTFDRTATTTDVLRESKSTLRYAPEDIIVSSSNRRSSCIERYGGRKSNDSDYFDKKELLKYKRQHSDGNTRYRDVVNDITSKNNNSVAESMKTLIHQKRVEIDDAEAFESENITNNNNEMVAYEINPSKDANGTDVVDHISNSEVSRNHLHGDHIIESAKLEKQDSIAESSEHSSNRADSIEKTDECLHIGKLNTEHQRRHRLKSISLDSDNAKIIEQNLGLPIVKHLKQENLSDAFIDCPDNKRAKINSGIVSPSIRITDHSRFTFDNFTTVVEKEVLEDPPFSPDLNLAKRSLRDASDTKSFVEMPRFSPKEFEIVITPDDGGTNEEIEPKKKGFKNKCNLTIDLNKRDSELEQELLEFEKLYSDAEKRLTPKTPTLKIKAASLDSSDSVNLSLPQPKTLEVPQNSVSVPNTPKKQFKRVLGQKLSLKTLDAFGGKVGYNSLQNTEQRRYCGTKLASNVNEGIFLRENHANLMLYQPNAASRTKVFPNNRRMGSFDENMAGFSENMPEINISSDGEIPRLSIPQKLESTGHLGTNLLNFKQNLSVSSTNLKTLPEGVPSIDFEPSNEKVVKKSILQRRGSNQSLPSSNCSLVSFGASCHSLASLRKSPSNFSLNNDNKQKSLSAGRPAGSNINLQGSHCNLTNSEQQQVGRVQPGKQCLFQRRGSNNSLTLNLQSSTSNLNRYGSNSSLNITSEAKPTRKGLLERRSSNTSLTLNINTHSNQPLTNCGLSVSNYNLDSSSYNMSHHNSNHSITSTTTEHKKGLLERRSSNTSLTLNINASNSNLNRSNSQDVPRDIEIDERLLDPNIKECISLKEKHRKSLSTENLIPRSYKCRIVCLKNTDNVVSSFGSYDDLWLTSYAMETTEESQGQNLLCIYGDQDNEMIYAFPDRQQESLDPQNQGFVRNITTKPLSPQTTSEDFKLYIANIQHLQSASNILSRQKLKQLNSVFRHGYSKSKCTDYKDQRSDMCCGRGDKREAAMVYEENSESVPCGEYQKCLIRALHQEFWDLPTNFQEKPMVFGSHLKNRYKSILPNEHSRFILKSETEEASEGYINANFIKGYEYSKNCYIATQGPLQNTVYDFWLMAYQNSLQFQDASLKTNVDRHFGIPQDESKIEIKTDEVKNDLVQKIVMLTNFIESGQQKCEEYFPILLEEEMVIDSPKSADANYETSGKKVDQKNERRDGSFVIKNIGILNKHGFTVRKLLVQYKHRNAKVVHEKNQSSGKASENRHIFKNIHDIEHKLDLRLGDDCIRDTIREVSEERDSCDLSDLITGSLDIKESSYSSEVAKNNIILVTDNIPKKHSSLLDNYCSDNNSENNRVNEAVDEAFVVYHYWFHNWVDHKCPKDVDSLLDLSIDILENCWRNFDAELKKSLGDLKTGDDKSCGDGNVEQLTGKLCDCSISSVKEASNGTKFVFPPLAEPKMEEHYGDEETKQPATNRNIEGIISSDNAPPANLLLEMESESKEPVCDDPLKEKDDTVDRKVYNLQGTKLELPPTIVHCSAGIGRTGCLIAILNGIQQLQSDQKVDILGIVCNMRLNRGGMVQNSEQYELIHKVLCLYEEVGLPPNT